MLFLGAVAVLFPCGSSDEGPSEFPESDLHSIRESEVCIDIATKEGSFRHHMRRRVLRRFDPQPPPCPFNRSVVRLLGEKKAAGVIPEYWNLPCQGAWKADPLIPRLTTSFEMTLPLEDVRARLWRMRVEWGLHRKNWEFLVFTKVVDAIGLTGKQPAGKTKQALVFALGEEPTLPYLVSQEVDVVGTDQPSSTAGRWADLGQHMSLDLEKVNQHGIATMDQMRQHATLQPLDFNKIEESHLWTSRRSSFDFIWSICSVEHAGSIRQGLVFMIKSLEFLKPGGTALHTTEFNLNDMVQTMDQGGTVGFRKVDMEALRYCALQKGYHVPEVCYDSGNGPLDALADFPPYDSNPKDLHHLSGWHLKMGGIRGNPTFTCIAMIFQKPLDFKDTGYDCTSLFTGLHSGSPISGRFQPPAGDPPVPSGANKMLQKPVAPVATNAADVQAKLDALESGRSGSKLNQMYREFWAEAVARPIQSSPKMPNAEQDLKFAKLSNQADKSEKFEKQIELNRQAALAEMYERLNQDDKLEKQLRETRNEMRKIRKLVAVEGVALTLICVCASLSCICYLRHRGEPQFHQLPTTEPVCTQIGVASTD